MSDPRPVLERGVDHALQLRYDAISEEVDRIAKWLVFDSLGSVGILLELATVKGAEPEGVAGP